MIADYSPAHPPANMDRATRTRWPTDCSESPARESTAVCGGRRDEGTLKPRVRSRFEIKPPRCCNTTTTPSSIVFDGPRSLLLLRAANVRGETSTSSHRASRCVVRNDRVTFNNDIVKIFSRASFRQLPELIIVS